MNWQGSNNPTLGYNSPQALHGHMNCSCCDEPSGESSSSAYAKNAVNRYSLQAGSPSDLPDLYYDQNWPSPNSTTSSNVISTPPPDWQMQWYQTEPPYISNHTQCLPLQQGIPYYPRQVVRPTVPPINTNCSSKRRIVLHSSVYFNHEDCGPLQQVSACFSPHTQPSLDTYASPISGRPSQSTLTSSTNSPYDLLSAPPPYPPHPPLKIHQPRPFRRIPIVSLSDLASASEDLSVSPHSKRANLKDAHGMHVGPGSLYSTTFSGGVLQLSTQSNTQPFYTASDGYRSGLAETPKSKAGATIHYKWKTTYITNQDTDHK
ncbi:hypothetical protein CPB84DRAFT_1347158 [Gymnopilus junonius]|uniref:Uncharacterized protein n=1 Tax=Gymnopilus junonius TaxID=109634 RepID=A0A9P5NZN4_GYMJU|nr:hypothetical protein CPB84DRAFT_1347158 [Gymnopilus junonius]